MSKKAILQRLVNGNKAERVKAMEESQPPIKVLYTLKEVAGLEAKGEWPPYVPEINGMRPCIVIDDIGKHR